MFERWINNLHGGYDTVLAGSGGAEDQNGEVTLTGGMRQWLALARAHNREPDVLILDASFFPSVCLYIPETDTGPQTNQRLRLTLKSASSHQPPFLHAAHAHKITLGITHNLSSISQSDFVYVMSAGRIIEQGFLRWLGAPRRCMGEHGLWNWCQARYWQWCYLPCFIFVETQIHNKWQYNLLLLLSMFILVPSEWLWCDGTALLWELNYQ